MFHEELDTATGPTVTSEGRIMAVDYTVEGDSFHNLKPRLWINKQIGTTSGNPPLGGGPPVFDLTADGARIIAWEPQEQPKEAKVDLRVTMLLNWSTNCGGGYRHPGSE